ncbi:MAG: twin-arginine translocase subunit TatC, partial [Planctomycetota bacterium]
MERLSAPKDNLFEESTMTFGEHLEELRKCLVWAVIWLVGGSVIGLFFASSVVRYVQTPLREAIKAFQADRQL